MKIATWNVNSVRVRTEHLSQWLKQTDVDMVFLQELKAINAHFPFEALDAIGYSAHVYGQPTYNGVACVYKKDLPIQLAQLGNPLCPDDPQKRLISVNWSSPWADVGEVCIIGAYMPNGESLESDKFIYKMQWLQDLHAYMGSIRKPIILLGDFNITVDDLDVYDPVTWHEKIHCSSQERAFFQQCQQHKLVDVLRHFHPGARIYSWWDYRQNAFLRQRGLRIDHIFAHESLISKMRSARVDADVRAWERPSDHAPVLVEFVDSSSF